MESERVAKIFWLEVESGRDFVVKGDGTISPKGYAAKKALTLSPIGFSSNYLTLVR